MLHTMLEYGQPHLPKVFWYTILFIHLDQSPDPGIYMKKHEGKITVRMSFNANFSRISLSQVSPLNSL
jgi:hypothetical protein